MLSCTDTSPNIPQTQSSNLYRLISSESLVAARWESINSVDLAAVLGSTFPSNGDTSKLSAEDVYDLYNDSVLNEVDTHMSDSVSEVVEGNTPFYPVEETSMDTNLVSPEVATLSYPLMNLDSGNGAIDGESLRSIMISHVGTSKPMQLREGCSAPIADMLDNRGGVSASIVQSLPFTVAKTCVSGDPSTSSHCVMDLKESMDPLGAGYMVPWCEAQYASSSSQVFEREKAVHSSDLRYRDNYSVIFDGQVMMADAASAELKRNRAQASRARRLAANQRRAKKYTLQKLIRMSSSSTTARDKVEQSVAGSVLQPVHLPVPSQYTGGVQTSPRSILDKNSALVLQGPHVGSSLEAPSQAIFSQAGPHCSYRQTLMDPSEDNQVSSGSDAKQSTCTDQDAQSLSSTPTPPSSHSTSIPQGLDAALLEQLQTILSKMNLKVRLCVRDALYRLAESAKHRQSKNDTGSDSSSSISKEEMETNTNSLDRWIVNILFCRQATPFERNPELHSTPHQLMHSFKLSSSSQNSCGSSANFQEPPLHVLTG